MYIYKYIIYNIYVNPFVIYHLSLPSPYQDPGKSRSQWWRSVGILNSRSWSYVPHLPPVIDHDVKLSFGIVVVVAIITISITCNIIVWVVVGVWAISLATATHAAHCHWIKIRVSVISSAPVWIIGVFITAILIFISSHVSPLIEVSVLTHVVYMHRSWAPLSWNILVKRV